MRSVGISWQIGLILVLATAIWMIAWFAPVDSVMGLPQKLVYLHVPAAVVALLACTTVFVASVATLWRRSSRWDRIAAASTAMAVGWLGAVLLTGMTWARCEWGHWWIWSPQLTFSLALFVLYASAILLRAATRSWPQQMTVCAVYGIAAFLDVPLVYLSARLIPDVHPSSIELDARMRLTLLVCTLASLLVAVEMAFFVWQLWRTRELLDPDANRVPEPSVHAPNPRSASAVGSR